MADGPVRWGNQVRSNKPGVFVVELGEPLERAPVDVSVCGKWAEHVTTLTVDGERPDGKQLARRLSSFWLPSQTVLYVASTEKSLAARVGALYATALGTRRPHPGGHWLKTLRGLEETRIWWAETNAPLEYEDGILSAFAEGLTAEERAGLPGSVVLPFANLQTSSAERKAHGVAGALLAAEEAPASSVARSVKKPNSASTSKAGKAAPKAANRTARVASTTGSRATSKAAPKMEPPKPEPTFVSPAGLELLEAELAELRSVQRPAVVARIKSARELGDLRENADYEAARKEQSFLEGRVQQLERMLKGAVIIETEGTGSVVGLGSTVVIATSRHGEETFTIVGSAEADVASGRISFTSPIGRALMGRRAGEMVRVEVPAGTHEYTIVRVS
jgi:transcription elongation factor GreA